MSAFLKIRRIETSKHECAKFTEVSLFLPSENLKGQQVYALFKCELYLVNGLQANILIRNDILAFKDFILNLKMCYAVVESCGITIPIKARQRGRFSKRQLLAKSDEIVPPCSKIMIPFLPVLLLDD